MKIKVEIASEANNSSLTSTLAHETRKNRRGLAMFVMPRSVFSTFLFCFLSFTFAQEGIDWKDNFGYEGSASGRFWGVTAVSDGVVAVGFMHEGNTGGWNGPKQSPNGAKLDALAVKYDHSGRVVWRKTFGGRGGDRFYGVTTVPGGVVAVGSSDFKSFGNGDWTGISASKDAEGTDVNSIIVKFDHSGNVVWKKNFARKDNYFSSVTTVTDGIVVAGHTRGDALIVKYDFNGNLLWDRKFGGVHPSGWDNFYSVTAVPGGVVAVGKSEPKSFGSGDWTDVEVNHNERAHSRTGDDAIIVKFDHSGNVVWKKNWGGGDDDRFTSVTTVPDGVVAVGETDGSVGHGRGAVVKWDNNGNMIWEREFVGERNSVESIGYLSNILSIKHIFSDVAALSDGVMIVGWYQGQRKIGSGLAVKYDHEGNVVRERTFGGRTIDAFHSVAVTADGIVAAGSADYESFGTGSWTGIRAKGGVDADDPIIVKWNRSMLAPISALERERRDRIAGEEAERNRISALDESRRTRPASTAHPSVTIVNNTGVYIGGFFIRPSGNSSWGDSWSYPISEGSERLITLDALSGTNRYDILLVTSGKGSFVKYNVLLSGNDRIVFTQSDNPKSTSQ